jgi:hypothetical protein
MHATNPEDLLKTLSLISTISKCGGHRGRRIELAFASAKGSGLTGQVTNLVKLAVYLATVGDFFL